MNFADFFNGAGTALQLFGSLNQAKATNAYGQEVEQSAQFQATQTRQQAGLALASAQRDAYFAKRQTDYVTSRAIAAAAASGGGASDPTVINTIAQIAAQGAYEQEMALYAGVQRSGELQMQADATEYEGASRRRAASSAASGNYFAAGANLLKGASTMYARYAGDGPVKTRV